MIYSKATQKLRQQCGGRARAPAVRAGGRRRTTHAVAPRASFVDQGPFFPGPGPAGPGPRRIIRRPRDLQQLAEVLSGGAADDPEQFLQLLSALPGVLGRRRAPVSPSEQDAAWQYARQLQQQQAAAAAAEAQRRAQQVHDHEEVEEQRREALRAAMLRNARRHLPQYNSDALARLASGLAAAGVRDPALCDDILRQMISQSPRQQAPSPPLQPPAQPRGVPTASSEPRSLAEVLDAFAAMRHRPSDAQLSELLRMQQQEQQREAEMERLRQAQAQQVLRSQPRLQPRGMVVPEAKMAAAAPPAGAAGPSSRTSPEDAARLLYALSRLGYKPDENTLTQLLEQLQPQRLQLEPAAPPQPPSAPESPSAASAGLPYGRTAQSVARRPQQNQPVQPKSRVQRPLHQSQQGEEGKKGERQPEEDEQQRQQQGEGAAGAENDDGASELEDQLSYSLQRDAQAVASAVRALERMGQLDKAQQLRERFMRHVQEMQARVAREREARLQQEQEEARERRAAAVAAEAAERERNAAAAAAAEAAEMERQAAAAVQRRQRQEEQARALRLQLTRKLRAADQWQQIRALLFTYQEALDVECLAAAASRLAELLTAARRTGRGLAMTLRERGELGDLLEGLGQLVLRRLEGASAAQAAGLLSSVVRMRHLEEGLVVGLLRRLRDTLADAGGSELAMTLRALAECGVRPSKPWMETFLARCEEVLEQFPPEDLATLPVCLAQLGAHPGRSWLGSYLDTLQEREGELSQASVSEAVRSVALMDRQFLSAWRQAVTAREQAQAQAWAQAQAEARARAAAAAVATAAEQEQGQRQQQQRQIESMQQRMPADALASVDEMLARGDVRQADREDDAVPEDLLPPMHPKQLSMSGQAQPPQPQEPQVQAAGAQAAPKGAGAEAMRLSDLFPMQSIELDVDNADLVGVDGQLTTGSTVPSPSSGPAAAGASGGAAATTSTLAGGRQLPGSYSIDGFYNPDPYDEDGSNWEGEEDEESEGEDLDAMEVPPNQSDAALTSQAGEALEEQAVVASAAGNEHTQQPRQEGAAVSVAREVKQPPTPEEVAQARALRSVLLERYEALLALRAEREEKERAAATDGGSSARVSEREVAAAARLLAAREQLQRLEADFDNFKRRAKAEREEAVSRAGAETLRPVLAVVDNFERAATQIKTKTAGERAVQEAYQAVYSELQDFLKRQGLKEVGIVGEAFDPNEHEAVMREDRDDVEDGTVTGVFQKGYRLGDVLVRPALVKVAYK